MNYRCKNQDYKSHKLTSKSKVGKVENVAIDHSFVNITSYERFINGEEETKNKMRGVKGCGKIFTQRLQNIFNPRG